MLYSAAVFVLAVSGTYAASPTAMEARHDRVQAMHLKAAAQDPHHRSKQMRHMASLLQGKTVLEEYGEHSDAAFKAFQEQCERCEAAEDAAVASFEAAANAHENADTAMGQLSDANAVVSDKEEFQQSQLDLTLDGKEEVIEAIEALEKIMEDLDLETDDENAKPQDQLTMVLTTSELGSTAMIKLKIANLKVLINDNFVPAVRATHAAEETAEDKSDAYKVAAKAADDADKVADDKKEKRDEDCSGQLTASPAPSP